VFYEKATRYKGGLNMENTLLIFDFDDTIIATNMEFEKTNELVANKLSTLLYGNTEKVSEILMMQRQFDIELIKTYGFARPRYLLSWNKTYEYFCEQTNHDIDLEVVKEVELLVNDVYERRFENIPDSIPVLKELRDAGYRMVILTAGEDEIQRKRVKESGALDFVDDVYVYIVKTPTTLKEVMDKNPAQHYVMIGNSLKSDIHPALENDVWAFHFERETWEADQFDIDFAHPKYVHIPKLTEIPKKLRKVLGQAESTIV